MAREEGEVTREELATIIPNNALGETINNAQQTQQQVAISAAQNAAASAASETSAAASAATILSTGLIATIPGAPLATQVGTALAVGGTIAIAST